MSGESNRHVSDHELILRLYSEAATGSASNNAATGSASNNAATGGDHVQNCPACGQRWNSLVERRDALAAESVQPSVEFLQEQRRAILAKVQQDSPARFLGLGNAWVPTVVAALLVMGLIATTPGTKRPAPKAASAQPAPEVADAAWFEDAYSVSQPVEPRAASAIRGLFTEGPVAR